jgi:hypothetical protein
MTEATTTLTRAASLVTAGGVQAATGKERRAGKPHEVFNSTLIVSSGLVGDGYGDGRRVLLVDTDSRGKVSDRLAAGTAAANNRGGFSLGEGDERCLGTLKAAMLSCERCVTP